MTHLYRKIDTEALQNRARNLGWRGELLVGTDGMQFPLEG